MAIPEFHRQMDQVKIDLLKMGGLVEEAIDDVMRSLLSKDADLARKSINGDKRIDALENEIEERCLKLLATRQPVAVDLRFLTSAIKISHYLERMGDQCVNVAERSLDLIPLDPIEIPNTLIEMGQIAQEMTRNCLEGFVHLDVSAAQEVCCRDEDLDNLNRQLLEEMITWMMDERRLIKRGVELILTGRHLERIGDEATNISEQVIYLVKGKVIRHPDLQPNRTNPCLGREAANL
ncbi:MAG: phosphate signaling complex protein PhoU [Deltaproteobacteria bacterium]|nr:phosphate signaling complex protein PhoU [Deltaproteobacteria bacterium]MBF0523465.1 phosphate signaling complex protein PhoU [Deltaproteobacteria bacterium]